MSAAATPIAVGALPAVLPAVPPAALALAQLPVPGLGVTFVAPWALALGAGVAAALVVLHAVTVGRPRPAWLPTARFAPDRPPRAARQLRRPRDLLLLAVRVLAALCAAAALARPVPTPARRATARLILADRSSAAAPAAVRAAVAAAARAGDVLLPFAARPGAPVTLAPDPAARARQLDSALGPAGAASAGEGVGSAGAATGSSAPRAADRALGSAPGDTPNGTPGGSPGASPGDTPGGAARRTASGEPDEAPNDAPHPALGRAPASLSAALVAARRAAPALAAGADSLELVLVAPLLAEQVDAATGAVRDAWAGRARVLRVAAVPSADAARSTADAAAAGRGTAPPGPGPSGRVGRPPASPATRPAVWLRDGPADDALAAALALAGVPAGGADAPVRVARGPVAPADLAWARAPGHVLVAWPADGVPDAPADRPLGGRPRGGGVPNTAGAGAARGGAPNGDAPRAATPGGRPDGLTANGAAAARGGRDAGGPNRGGLTRGKPHAGALGGDGAVAAGGRAPAADTALALVALAAGPADAWAGPSAGAPADAPAGASVGTGALGPAVAVAPFVRRALADTAPFAGPAGTPTIPRVLLRWADGRPAAVERPADAAATAGAGCVRTVAVAVPQAGDAALRAGFHALLPAVLGPCGGPRDPTPLSAADVAHLAGRGPLLAAAPLRARLGPPAPDRLGAALLAAALLALAAELPLRRLARRGTGAGADALGGAPDASPRNAPTGRETVAPPNSTPPGRGPAGPPARPADRPTSPAGAPAPRTAA